LTVQRSLVNFVTMIGYVCSSYKINLDSLLSSDKEEYTKEEIKALKEELLKLRCHEEFSKKFEALAQDYLRKKTNK